MGLQSPPQIKSGPHNNNKTHVCCTVYHTNNSLLTCCAVGFRLFFCPEPIFSEIEKHYVTLVGHHHHRRSSTRPIDLIECIDVSVHQLPRRLHADLQPDLHDAPHRPLVGLPPVPGANAAGTGTVRRLGPFAANFWLSFTKRHTEL